MRYRVIVTALNRKNATLTSDITKYARERTVTIAPCKIKMLICTPLAFVLASSGGISPSRAVQSSPQLGPLIQDITPPRPPKANSKQTNGVAQEMPNLAKIC